VKKVIGIVLTTLIAQRLHWLAAIAATIAVTAKDGRPTLVRWDGQDWQFKWSDGCLFWTSPLLSPRRVTQQHMRQYLGDYQPKPGDTIVDVGAGVGTEVCLFSNMVGIQGRVIAIEADPLAARLLRKQADCLPHRNVQVLEVAVGRDEGVISLSVAEPGAVQNSVSVVVGTSCVSVRSMPLEKVLEDLGVDRVSYMKMNIEGAEYDALLGLGSAISKIEKMVISCHDFTGVPEQKTFDSVKGYLETHDVRIVKSPVEAKTDYELYYIHAEGGEQ